MARLLPSLQFVIDQLQALFDAYGDIPVVLEDPETGWPMVPDLAYYVPTALAYGDWQAIGPCVSIRGGHGQDHIPVFPHPGLLAVGGEQ